MAELKLDPERYKAGDATIVTGKPKISLAVSESGLTDVNSATFVIVNEDHTLGNSLRWVLLQDPDVVMSAYTVPHPSEKQINLRIQTNGKETAQMALEKALQQLKDIAENVRATFEASVDLPVDDLFASLLGDQEEALAILFPAGGTIEFDFGELHNKPSKVPDLFSFTADYHVAQLPHASVSKTSSALEARLGVGVLTLDRAAWARVMADSKFSADERHCAKLLRRKYKSQQYASGTRARKKLQTLVTVRTNAELMQDNADLRRENAELRRQIISARLHS